MGVQRVFWWSNGYSIEEGWTSLGPIVPSIEAAYEYDIHLLDNPALGAYDSLTKCADA